jgi:hypothetical protein
MLYLLSGFTVSFVGLLDGGSAWIKHGKLGLLEMTGENLRDNWSVDQGRRF